MKTSYDLVCIGYGPVTRQLLRYFPDLDILIVSDNCSESFPNAEVVNYSEFSNLTDKIPFSNVIVSVRLEVLGTQSHEYIVQNEDFWNYLRHCRIIAFSSVSVYGDGKKAHTEEDAPNPLDAYAVSKVFLEDLFLSRVPSENVLILRIANLYGATGVSVFFDHLRNAITAGQTLSIPNSKCLRDFVHVLDLCEFIAFWMNSKLKFENQVLNFGTGLSSNLIEIIQLAENLGDLTFEINRDAGLPAIPISRISVDRLNELWDFSKTELNSDLLRKLLST